MRIDTDENSIIEFGSYPYDAGGNIKPLRWKALQIKDQEALLITEDVIDAMPFHGDFDGETWSGCDIRKWLHGEFLNTAFTEKERAVLLTPNIYMSVNPYFGLYPGEEEGAYWWLRTIGASKEMAVFVGGRTSRAFRHVYD